MLELAGLDRVNGQLKYRAVPLPFPPCTHGKGLPKQADVESGIGLAGLESGWAVQYRAVPLPFPPCTMAKACPNRRMWKQCWAGWTDTSPIQNRLLSHLSKAWLGQGLPDLQMLKENESSLSQWLSSHVREESDNDEDKDEEWRDLIKIQTLYLSTRSPKWSISRATLERFYLSHTDTGTDTEVISIAEHLTSLLYSFGGPGVERYLKANNKDRSFFLAHSGYLQRLSPHSGGEGAQ